MAAPLPPAQARRRPQGNGVRGRADVRRAGRARATPIASPRDSSSRCATRLDGEEVRRSYSICSGVNERNGSASPSSAWTAAGSRTSPTRRSRPGAALDVMTPDGPLLHPARPGAPQALRRASSRAAGITPVLSLIKTTLDAEPGSARSRSSTATASCARSCSVDELEDLKNRYLGRLRAVPRAVARSPGGRALQRPHRRGEVRGAPRHPDPGRRDRRGLRLRAGGDDRRRRRRRSRGTGCAPERIHVERFASPSQPAPAVPRVGAPVAEAEGPAASVTVIADGKQRHLRVGYDGESILDMALHAGADLPFACKARRVLHLPRQGGRGRGADGQELRARRPTRSRAGFVLSCQSHPVTERVVVSYDER